MEVQGTLFDLLTGRIPDREEEMPTRDKPLPLHHFRCKRDGEWKVVESIGEVVSVTCPVCGRPMKAVEVMQQELPLRYK